jgi:hypothetical protein
MSNFPIPLRFPNPTVVDNRVVSDSNRPSQRRCPFIRRMLRLTTLLSILAWSVSIVSQSTAAQGQTSDAAASESVQPLIGPGSVIVHSKFGGQIFGFDIDQNGTEGVLSESQNVGGGQYLVAVETFDQNTGNIIKVVTKLASKDDFVTLGVVGNGVGLVEREHVKGIYVVKRIYEFMKPLSSNAFTGTWTPPIDSKHIIEPTGVSRSQGVPNVAVFVEDNSGGFTPLVFSSNVATNTFGPITKITDSNNFGSVPAPIAYDSHTNHAILGGGPGCFGCLPVIGLVDLTKGKFTEFTGIGFGFINGIAVDSQDGIFCTTTEDDAGVEFYRLAKKTGFTEQLPGSGGNQFNSGADVEFDPLHKLFLVAQPNSSRGSGSTIYVYDSGGNLQETLNGFNFSNAFNVIPAHIALSPSKRSGYVDGPGNGELQSFTY